MAKPDRSFDAKRRRISATAALFAAAAALAACGGDKNTAPSPSGPAPTPPGPGPGPGPGPVPSPSNSTFPLKVVGNTRYLSTASGAPFLLHGDSPWSIGVQLTRSQITTYLDDRQTKGFNAIMFSAVEHEFSSQTPPWKNAEGNVPFSPQGNFGTRLDPYWQLIDYIIAEANQRGIVCIVHPAYLGYLGGSQGWTAEVLAESTSDLFNYGAALANRYRGRGVIWCMGGDYAGEGHPGLLDKQWNIALGIRSVDPAALLTAHGGRRQSAYSFWGRFTGLNLNNIYTAGIGYEFAATEYARPGPLPFFHIEGQYDGDGSPPALIRAQAYTAILSGACGHMFGNFPIWGFGEPQANGGIGPAAALNSLSTPATVQMQYVKQLFSAYDWWTLVPRNDAGLVASPLGAGMSRVCPALAASRQFAMVWVPAGAAMVNLASLAPARIRARWFDPTSGTYSTAGAGTYPNTGNVEFTAAADAVLVLDAA